MSANSHSAIEQERIADLIRLLPRGRGSILDVGARDGRITQLLPRHFREVTALDLERPAWESPGIRTVAGNACNLDFPDASFDCVLCSEVIEHIPAVEQACRELARVARHEVVIGVPFRQDLRLGQMRCRSCGKLSPPYGHVNRFDERRLADLFPDLVAVQHSYVGETREATNHLAVWLARLAGNPDGPYDQQEPCIHCGARLVRPEPLGLTARLTRKAGVVIERVQSSWTPPRARWIHAVFSRRSRAAAPTAIG